MIDHKATRVRFEAFGPSSLDIKVFTYILVSDFVESRAIWHDILLAIHDRLTAAGLRLVLPTGRVRLLAEDEAETAEPG